VDVVTGAFSFTGRYVAARLLDDGREVRTLTRRPLGDSPFGDRVQALPLDFGDPAALVAALQGAETLYVTYWIRFPDRSTSFEAAAAASARLFVAAREAGVGKVVYLSVANAAADSPHPYFRGKAEVEAALAASGLEHAIVRPTLVFGEGEVLVNNVAWLLRRLPLFALPRRRCAVQPVAAEDVAELCVAAKPGATVDAAGPDVYPFEELARLVRAAVGSRAAIVRAGERTTLALSRALGVLTRQTLLTADELQALRDDLLTSAEPPRGRRRFADWLAASAPLLGRRLASGDHRPWPEGRGPSK
jgi:NADH dehydrogenase